MRKKGLFSLMLSDVLSSWPHGLIALGPLGKQHIIAGSIWSSEAAHLMVVKKKERRKKGSGSQFPL